MNRQNALRLSHRSRTRLGLASGRSPDLRFVEPEQPSQNILQWPTSAQFSANTVAGQWRILTAFPNTRLCDLYSDEKERSNATCDYSPYRTLPSGVSLEGRTACYSRIQLLASSSCGSSSCSRAYIISNPVTKRGPGREKYALAFTAYTLRLRAALRCFHPCGNCVA